MPVVVKVTSDVRETALAPDAKSRKQVIEGPRTAGLFKQLGSF